MNMNIKAAILLVFSAATAGAGAAGDVTGMTVRQNWPWDTRVVIDFTIAGDEGKTYDVDVTIEGPAGKVLSKANAFDSELVNLAPGAHRVIWNPAGAYSGNLGSSAAVGLKFTLSCREAATSGKYMVVDFSGASSWTVTYLNAEPAGGWTGDYISTKMVFRRIRPGYFLMGSPAEEEGHISVRKQGLLDQDRVAEVRHPVLLTNEYWIAVFPATTAQLCNMDDRATSSNVSEEGKINYYDANANAAANRPCFGLNYIRLVGEGEEYITKWPSSTDVREDSVIGQARAKLAGAATPPGLVFYLPTDAQWEYACRAGTETSWNNGTDCATNAVGVDANLDLLGRYQPIGTNRSTPIGPVGSKLPNAWGLYDCHGNIGEIVADGMGNLSSSDYVVEPAGPSHSSNCYCLLRGGAFTYCWAVHCRSAARLHSNQYNERNKTAVASAAKSHGVRFAFIHPRSGGAWR